MMRLTALQTRQYHWLNFAIVVGSVLLCLLLLPSRPPGMELLGIGPSWLLIWVVAWSVKRTPWQGAIAGLVLGILHDAMAGTYPSHIFGLIGVGILTALLQKQRFIQEDFVSVALIVFAMVVLAQTTMALQVSLHRLLDANSPYPDLAEIWLQHQRIALSSAIISSLWAPVLYYPLNRWWGFFDQKVNPPSL